MQLLMQRKKYRSIVLLTDGEDHDEDAAKVTRQLADEGVMINTIGIGSPEGALIPDRETNGYKKDENDNPVLSKLNEVILKEIAQNANGLYQLFTTTDEVVNNLQKQLSGLGQTTLSDTAFATYAYYFIYFLWAALILLLIEFLFRKKKAYSSNNKTSCCNCCFFVFSKSPFSSKVNKEILKGNKAYKNNQFDMASSAYQKALQKAPDNNIAFYNLGNALYKAGKPEDAVNSFDAAVQASKEKV